MGLPITAEQVGPRFATGAFILHSGIEKLGADDVTAKGVHGMATSAYPFLERADSQKFVRALAIGEIAIGTALLVPFVPAGVAGAALTGFSAGLLGLYAKAPGLRKPGSVWPTPQGLGVSKDVWMLGAGLGLLGGSLSRRKQSRPKQSRRKKR